VTSKPNVVLLVTHDTGRHISLEYRAPAPETIVPWPGLWSD
jgi:hypothetical protein